MSTSFQDAQRQIAELTTLAADLERAAPVLSAEPAVGPCDDTCGCVSDTAEADDGGPGRVEVAVPLISKADASAAACGCDDEVPIACTLGAGEMSGRLEEWNSLLAEKQEPMQGLTARHTLEDGGLRLEFGANTDVSEIARLAAAEQACCRFFAFAVTIDNRGVALEIHAPPDGLPVLTALFGAAA